MRFVYLLAALVLAAASFIEPPAVNAQAQQMLIAFGGIPSTPGIVGQTIGTLRNDFGGCVGFSMQIAAGADITITDLGRWVVSGNSGSHLLTLIGQTNNVIGTVTVNTSGAPANAYLYGAITPVVATHSGNYAVLSKEVNGGDQWGDNDTTITFASVINPGLGQPVVSSQPDCTSLSGNSGPTHSYVPPNFKYHL